MLGILLSKYGKPKTLKVMLLASIFLLVGGILLLLT